MFFAAPLFWVAIATVSKTNERSALDGPWVDMQKVQSGIGRRSGRADHKKEGVIPPQIPGKIMLALGKNGSASFQIEEYGVEYPEEPWDAVGDIGQAIDGACERLGIERITTSA